MQSKCPVDNETLEERQLFLDKIAFREIQGLMVRCSNYRQDCTFEGELAYMQVSQNIPIILCYMPGGTGFSHTQSGRGKLYSQNKKHFFHNLGAVSIKLSGAKLAPKIVCFVLRKELLNFSEMVPCSFAQTFRCTRTFLSLSVC